MSATQFFKAKPPTDLMNCHGGEGTLVFHDLIKDNEKQQFIKFIHRDILKTGVSIGLHRHDWEGEEPTEEWYYCVSGNVVMTLDGKNNDFTPGDICVCRSGGMHGLKNIEKEDLEIIVFYASKEGCKNG